MWVSTLRSNLPVSPYTAVLNAKLLGSVDFELSCAYIRPRRKRARVAKAIVSNTVTASSKDQSQPWQYSRASSATARTNENRRDAELSNRKEADLSVHTAEPTLNLVSDDLYTEYDFFPISAGCAAQNDLVSSRTLRNSSNLQAHEDAQAREYAYVETMKTPNRIQDCISLDGIKFQTENTYKGLRCGTIDGASPPDEQIRISVPDGRRTVQPVGNQSNMDLSGVHFQPPKSFVPLQQSLTGGDLQAQFPVSISTQLKYPVLQPLVPSLRHPLNAELACSLLEYYFSTRSGTYVPTSPFLLGHILRYRSFLRSTSPRKCSPALLASILWVAAESTDEPFSKSPPTARSSICQTLLDLVLKLLYTLPQAQNAFEAHRRLPLTDHSYIFWNSDYGVSPTTGSFDDVITLVHLATVVSAGRYRSASFRWWHSALQLAKELKLNHEMPMSTVSAQDLQTGENLFDGISTTVGDLSWYGDQDQLLFANSNLLLQDMNSKMPHASLPVHNTSPYTAEGREERRRVWWTLYILDRHLALSFNSSLMIREAECDEICFPDSEDRWQEPDIYSDVDITLIRLHQWTTSSDVCKSIKLQQLSHGTFAFFIPLMSILGQIIDIQHARSHPQLGKIYKGHDFQTNFIGETSVQLDAFREILDELLHARNDGYGEYAVLEAGSDIDFPSIAQEGPRRQPMQHNSKSDFHKHTVAAYGKFFLYVMQILIHGKWDLTTLFEDENHVGISRPSLHQTLNHALAAAGALDDILQLDVDLSFNPYVLGIYLLQGSFIPFVLAANCQNTTSPAILKACKSFIRAHEICVVTLDTDYQVCSSNQHVTYDYG